MYRRLTPYLFFTLAAAALIMIAIQGDAGFEKEVDPIQALMIVIGTFAGAHALRHVVLRFWDKGES